MIVRLTELCDKAEKAGRATMNIKRKDLNELFGGNAKDMKAIVHGSDGGSETFVRVDREYLADRLSKLAEPEPAEKLTPPPVDVQKRG